MTYATFKAEYESLFKTMMGYKPNEVGSSIYAEKMADLADAYPEFEAMIDAELDA